MKRYVLAYSGGLDTSIILKWLRETYACEVVTFTADLGQGEDLEPARRRAEMTDEEFVEIGRCESDGDFFASFERHFGIDVRPARDRAGKCQ